MNLVAACLLAASLRALQEPPATADEAVYAELAAELGLLADGVTVEAVGRRLSALSPGSAALVFDALGREELPTPAGPLVLDERAHAALLEGARRLGRVAFVDMWSTAATAPDGARRRTAIELVGHCGRSTDLVTAVLAATPLQGGEGVDLEALPLLEEAGARLLARAPDTLPAMRPAILRAPPEIAGALIRALGHAPEPRALRLLSELLGRDDRLDLPLLSEMERSARRMQPPFEESLYPRVRAYLADTDRQLVRMAAVTLSALQDEAALPALIELCATRDAALAGAAFLALERTTGMALPRRPERWRAWFESEQRWASGEGARIPAVLDGPDVPRILASLRSLATHRLERQRYASLTAPLLEHAHPGVRLEACRTLGALALPATRAVVEAALSDPDPGVVAAARAALLSLQRGA